MSDQAETLRKLMIGRVHSGEGDPDDSCSPRVVTVASVTRAGRSSFVAHLGVLLARLGHRVLLVDGNGIASTGSSRLEDVLGVSGTATLEDVIRGMADLKQAVFGVEPNLWLVPAGAGLFELTQSDPETRGRVLEVLGRADHEVDVILVDARSGMHAPGSGTVIVLTPGDSALTEAYALVKRLKTETGISEVNVIVNRVTDGAEGVQTFKRLKNVVGRFTDLSVEYLGHWPNDEKITQAVRKQKILLDLYPRAPSIACLELLAKRFRIKYLGISESDQASRIVKRPLTLGRFREEPARLAPGNTAKFWRTLLCEVKA
ncbi:MAG TPA: hypothetical protein VJB59_07080 [Bdellovibrionota bacterium]|nr:hypothetical protein [Bdellovibrionota bacterium]